MNGSITFGEWLSTAGVLLGAVGGVLRAVWSVSAKLTALDMKMLQNTQRIVALEGRVKTQVIAPLADVKDKVENGGSENG